MKKYLLLLLATMFVLYADVTKETYSRMKMASGLVSSEITSKTETRADMRLNDDNVQTTTVFTGKPQHAGTITRLDKELIWHLNHGNKTYAESPLRLPEEKVKVEAEAKGQGDTVKDYRIVKSELTVKKLDSARTINGFPCTGYIATWTLVVEKIKTKEQTTSIMTLTEWTTPVIAVLKQAEAEEAAYNQAYLAKLGLGLVVPSPQSPVPSPMMGMQYLATLGMTEKDIAERLKGYGDELAKIQGYPIVTETKWTVPVDTTKAKQEVKHEESRLPPSLGSLMGKVLTQNVIPKPSLGDAGVMFTFYLEVKSVSVGPTGDQDFEIPEGYKKQ